MHDVFLQLLILLTLVWAVAVFLNRYGIPTVMGELVAGVIVGPAVLGWIEPNEIIDVLAQMGIFFLMLHAGVETEPREFFYALRKSWGVAIVGAIVPFSVSVGVAMWFGLTLQGAIFVGLTMTATAVVVTLKILQELGLARTRMARVVIASCVIDDLISLVMFSFALGMLSTGSADPMSLLIITGKILVFVVVALAAGVWIYPRFQTLFRNPKGKGFTFVLVLGLAGGLLAEWLGLHILIGAYAAGLFFEERVASKELVTIVTERLYAISYSFLGPIFFISLGFQITFEPFSGVGLPFMLALTGAVFIGQILSAGGMARPLGFSWTESAVVGVGMCGRAEMAFVLAAIGLSSGAFSREVFTVIIATALILNILTAIGLKVLAGHVAEDRAHWAKVDGEQEPDAPESLHKSTPPNS
jgi:Na+:H+ antiporter